MSSLANSEVRLRRASGADIAYILKAERLPGYEHLVACWSADEHWRAMASLDTAYWILESPDQTALGFAILDGLRDRHQGVKLKRIVMDSPGHGLGYGFLRALGDWVFTQTPSERWWLDVFATNTRARRAYLKIGMTEDGVLRQAYVLPDGTRADRVLMSVLRGEWQTHP